MAELEGTARACYLGPAEELEGPMTFSEVRPRARGWIDIRLGGLHRGKSGDVLVVTEIVGERTGARDDAERAVRWLKRALNREVHKGVIARNVDSGGEASYGDIYFTNGAVGVRAQGVSWKQYSDGKVEFSPA
jgi:hypothetical protein